MINDFQLVIVSVKDLHKLYPDIVPKNTMSETKGTSMNQVKLQVTKF